MSSGGCCSRSAATPSQRRTNSEDTCRAAVGKGTHATTALVFRGVFASLLPCYTGQKGGRNGEGRGLTKKSSIFCISSYIGPHLPLAHPSRFQPVSLLFRRPALVIPWLTEIFHSMSRKEMVLRAPLPVPWASVPSILEEIWDLGSFLHVSTASPVDSPPPPSGPSPIPGLWTTLFRPRHHDQSSQEALPLHHKNHHPLPTPPPDYSVSTLDSPDQQSIRATLMAATLPLTTLYLGFLHLVESRPLQL